jgi:hypothetical protein
MSLPGTLPPEVYGASDEAKRVETRPVPPPFHDFLLSNVVSPVDEARA